MERNTVLIIGAQETFSVHGMEMKLKEMGYVGKYVSVNIKELQANADLSNLIVYYMDETVSDDPAFLVYLKDLCMENDKSLILVGTKEEHNQILKVVPENCIAAWFDRPLDMKKFLDCVSKQFDSMVEGLMRKTILIIDDDVAYMQMVREWLKDAYQVVMVDSGVKAIKWLANNKADMVLLDYQMPITNGPQIFEMLKSDSDTDVIPVMFLTGQQSKDSVITAMKLKPVDYLLKSIGKVQLKEKLDQYFAIQKAKV